MSYRIMGENLVLEGEVYPRLFPQAKSAVVNGVYFTAVKYTRDAVTWLNDNLGTAIPLPPDFRVIGRHLVLEGLQYKEMFPGGKHAEVKGVTFTALDHTVELSQYLNNMGVKVPSPIKTQYAFKSTYPKPMVHQVATADFLTLNRRAYNISDMGSAKTLSSLWAVDFLMSRGLIRRVLVVSPLSTIQDVWAKEIFVNFPHRSYNVVYGSRDVREKLCKEQRDFYIVNHHGVEIVTPWLSDEIDLIIIDELAIYRNKMGLWNAMKEVIKPRHWVWGLTGTPTPNAPTDAFYQMKLITPENYPSMSFRRCKQMMMIQVSMFKYVPRKGSEEMASKMLQPSIRYELKDCVDMPETIYHERHAELTAQQTKHYKEIEREMCTTINGMDVTAVNAAVLLNKLVQASCGVVYGANGNSERLDFGNRLTVLKDCIEESNHKTIVFVPLTEMLHALHEKLKKWWGCDIIEGSVSPRKRAETFTKFREDPETKLLIANPAAMSHGINLICATTTIWYCPIHSNEVYTQANARMRRPGQKNVTNIVHIYGTKVEKKIYERLKEKGSMQDLVLDLVRERG